MLRGEYENMKLLVKYGKTTIRVTPYCNGKKLKYNKYYDLKKNDIIVFKESNLLLMKYWWICSIVMVIMNFVASAYVTERMTNQRYIEIKLLSDDNDVELKFLENKITNFNNENFAIIRDENTESKLLAKRLKISKFITLFVCASILTAVAVAIILYLVQNANT